MHVCACVLVRAHLCSPLWFVWAVVVLVGDDGHLSPPFVLWKMRPFGSSGLLVAVAAEFVYVLVCGCFGWEFAWGRDGGGGAMFVLLVTG